MSNALSYYVLMGYIHSFLGWWVCLPVDSAFVNAGRTGCMSVSLRTCVSRPMFVYVYRYRVMLTFRYRIPCEPVFPSLEWFSLFPFVFQGARKREHGIVFPWISQGTRWLAWLSKFFRSWLGEFRTGKSWCFVTGLESWDRSRTG